jgi:plastocyanin domain-containing protein
MDEALLEYIKEYLIDEVNNTELTEKTCEDIDDGISYGRKELAEILIQRIAGYERALIDVNANQALRKALKKMKSKEENDES